jgi:DnaK suppressor protein
MKLDLKQQKKRLEAKKAELQRSIADLSEAHPRPVPSIEAHEGPQDHADVATDFLEIQNEQSLLVNEQALLTLVERALNALENGTYGLCQECGQPIPVQRLEAMPWAERDVRCEQKLEMQYLSREDVYGPPQTF